MLDPEDDVPEAGASTDMSKPSLQNAWQQWTSNPANNAALLQFGIAMMQPRAPGQSGIGQFANSIGEAGGAAGRVTAAQDAETERESRQAERESEAALRETQGQASLINANAYKTMAAKSGGGGGVSSTIATQRAFNTWLAKPEDPLATNMNNGNSNDPIVQALQRQFPNIKSKGDILADPQARRAAYQLFSTQLAEPGDEGGTPAPTVTPPAAAQPSRPVAPPPGTPRTIYKGTQAYTWDGIVGHAPVPVAQ